jgi:NAD(P)-dependent dehydrogenase (short-subunit alcohol dehydrogenase family)
MFDLVPRRGHHRRQWRYRARHGASPCVEWLQRLNLGPQCGTVCDVTDPASVTEAMKATLHRFGRIDG